MERIEIAFVVAPAVTSPGIQFFPSKPDAPKLQPSGKFFLVNPCWSHHSEH